MISLIATTELAFKLLAPRNSDWASILPEISVAGLALFCLVQAMFLNKKLNWLIPTTARIGLGLIILMSLIPFTAWNPHDGSATSTFSGLLQLTDITWGFRLTF
jgi:hypothetical protein